MCGIVGMVGREECADVLLDGLKRLEYRGYDSAGIATICGGEYDMVRCAGKLSRLETAMRERRPRGCVGVGHTRWATHGRPCEENAHPHRYKECVVVHNGIVENFVPLKQELAARGHVFSSQTDSEIIAHLVQEEAAQEQDWPTAVRRALLRLRGSFAVAVLHQGHPDVLVAARRMSPLVVGLGEGENFVASDIPALLARTRRFVFMQDGEMAVVAREGVRLYALEDGRGLERGAKVVSWTPAMAEKGGYKHFMLKEIHEQPRAVADTVGPRLWLSEGEVLLPELDAVATRLREAERLCIVACGTSYHAGLVGKAFVERFARLPCDVEVASEFRYRDPLVGPKQMLVCVSQSGETADTLAALEEGRRKGAAAVAICNVVDSSLARLADAVLYTHAGPEIGVASTKAFVCQMAAFYLLAVWLGTRRGVLSADLARERLVELAELPGLMERTLMTSSHVLEVARKHLRVSTMLYLGRGVAFPIALEGALKLKELSYVHAEGYPAGEMKHGPIALVDDTVPSLFIVPAGVTFEKTLSNIEEIRSRSGQVLAVAEEGERRVCDLADDVFPLPACPPALLPFLAVLPLQLFAYHVADQKGTDVDQPRNLAKSVTVE